MLQPLFRKLQWLSLRGMNYGAGYSPSNWGELFFEFCKKTLKDDIVILDVGANMGKYALLFDNIFQTKCLFMFLNPQIMLRSF